MLMGPAFPRHRQSFRSDVLVSFNPPIKLTVKDTPSLVSTPTSPVSFSSIRSLTQFMYSQLASNTVQSPTWDLIRVSKTAGRIYVPLGTRMGLGDWVRVMARFVEGFASPSVISAGKGLKPREKLDWEGRRLESVAEVEVPKASQPQSVGSGGEDSRTITSGEGEEVESERDKLAKDLRAYQNHVESLGLKDDRIRRSEGVPRVVLLFRLLLRLSLGLFLLLLTIPGLILWLPVFLTTQHFVRKLKASGPVWDTEDEVAQIKLIYGVASVCVVWMVSVLATLPFTFLTGWLIPVIMWMTLRWTEDMVASFRAAYSLFKLLRVGKEELKRTREWRKDLRGRVMTMAVDSLGLPEDPETVFRAWDTKLDVDEELPSRWSNWTMSDRKDQKGRSGGAWDSGARYFSIRRRRKRDWNETLRWFDAADPKDE
ncbi:hypothetical protein FRC02_010552 [Tulasnella sp. 418]|nr:hypothetical protein FRC02_010552 [Tulasnella sp. 418]